MLRESAYLPPSYRCRWSRSFALTNNIVFPSCTEFSIFTHQSDFQRPQIHVNGDTYNQRPLHPAVAHLAAVHRKQMCSRQLHYPHWALRPLPIPEIFRITIDDRRTIMRPTDIRQRSSSDRHTGQCLNSHLPHTPMWSRYELDRNRRKFAPIQAELKFNMAG